MSDGVIDQLDGLIAGVSRPHPVRVGLDGVDASGKTTLADELVRPIEQRGGHVIRVLIDGFHRPRAERYRLGVDSPEGYYLDSFDHGALRDVLLVPLGPQGVAATGALSSITGPTPRLTSHPSRRHRMPYHYSMVYSSFGLSCTILGLPYLRGR